MTFFVIMAALTTVLCATAVVLAALRLAERDCAELGPKNIVRETG